MQNWKITRDATPLTGEPAKDPKNPNAPNTVGNRDNVVASAAGRQVEDAGFASFSHPKLKFNFTVDIELRVTLDNSGSSTFGSDRMEALDIPVKTATRPSPTIVYTDVNYYNYRTKVATKTDYGTASITFYDDADDKVQSLYKTYLNYVSPISNLSAFMTLDKLSETPFGELSSLDMLPANAAQGLIRVLRIHHFYKHKNKFMRTTYACMNPKINSFQPDDLSMSESDVNTITLEFNYDGLNISTVEIP